MDPATLLALLGLALHLAAEPIMRRGGARALATTRFERGSTLLVSGLGLGALLLAGVVRLAGLQPPFPPGGASLALAALVFAGAGLRYGSMAALGEHFTRTLRVAEGQELVRRGPYRVIRHPGYTANLLAYGAGSGAIASSWLVVAGATPALALAYHHRIRSEEAMLAEHLGDAYRTYQRETWRLLPGLY